MGKPKFSRKKYETPKHPWQEERIKEEDELIKKYGLKNKKEIWKAQTQLRRYRSQARELLASVQTGDEQSKKESEQLLNRLSRMNILPTNSTLDDVLALETEVILSRRLQTLTYLKGLAATPKQARQLISHGHITVGGRRVTIPSYMITKKEEANIGYTDLSPLNDSMHPARPKSDYTGKIGIAKKEIKPETKDEGKSVERSEKQPSKELTEEAKTEEKVEEPKKEEEKLIETKEEISKEQKAEDSKEEEKTAEETKPEKSKQEEVKAEEKKEEVKPESNENDKKKEDKGGKE